MVRHVKKSILAGIFAGLIGSLFWGHHSKATPPVTQTVTQAASYQDYYSSIRGIRESVGGLLSQLRSAPKTKKPNQIQRDAVVLLTSYRAELLTLTSKINQSKLKPEEKSRLLADIREIVKNIDTACPQCKIN